jgi:hypothetical protein
MLLLACVRALPVPMCMRAFVCSQSRVVSAPGNGQKFLLCAVSWLYLRCICMNVPVCVRACACMCVCVCVYKGGRGVFCDAFNAPCTHSPKKDESSDILPLGRLSLSSQYWHVY